MPDLLTTSGPRRDTGDRCAATDLDTLTNDLERLLLGLAAEQEALFSLGEARDAAITAANMRALAEAVAGEHVVVTRIAGMDRERSRIVERLLRWVGAPSRGEPTPTARWIAARLPSEGRDRILAAADRLRAAIERTAKQNASARVAAETLAAHMQGLLRAAAKRASHAGTYGHRGVVEHGPAVVSAMDVTS